MDVEYCWGEEGEAFFVREHLPLDEFMDRIKNEVDPNDPILKSTPRHCWMRVCRDFQNNSMVYAEAKPASKGSFKCTWLQ